jgi:hypothetical protein
MIKYAPELLIPNAPKKNQRTISRVQNLYYNNRVNNAEKLQRYGRNVAEMFEPNEHVEVVNFTPTEKHMIETNYEHSRESVRAGMSTPPRQIKFTGPLALYPKAPNAPVKKRKTRCRRAKRHTRKN